MLQSGRALARASVGGGLANPALSVAEWVLISTIDHVSSSPPYKPDFGFSHGPASSIRHRKVRYRGFRRAIEVKADPAISCPRSALPPSFDETAAR